MHKRGTITFVFDDGYRHIFDQVVPLLDHHRLPGVFAVSLQAETAWQQWLPLAKRGHEIAAHSITHTDLTKLGDAQLLEELAGPAKNLGATTLVYPGGGYNDRVVAAARKHYRAARTVQKGFESASPRDPYRLKTYNFTRENFSIWKANLLALYAWVTGRWLIETYHLVTDEVTDELHTVSRAAFERHLSFVARLPLAVRTIRDMTV